MPYVSNELLSYIFLNSKNIKILLLCNAKPNNSHQEVFDNFGVKHTSRLNVSVSMNVGLKKVSSSCGSCDVCYHCPLCLVLCKNGDLVDLMSYYHIDLVFLTHKVFAAINCFIGS